MKLTCAAGDFLGGPVVKTACSNAGGVGLIPGQRVEISQASQPKHKTEVTL